MADRRSDYRAFLLRLWRADNGGQPVWRLSLKEAGARQQRVFHGVDALHAFLTDLITAWDEGDSAAGPAGGGSPPPVTPGREDRS
jgi:hypothetical protein